jgi:hypothetical protein
MCRCVCCGARNHRTHQFITSPFSDYWWSPSVVPFWLGLRLFDSLVCELCRAAVFVPYAVPGVRYAACCAFPAGGTQQSKIPGFPLLRFPFGLWLRRFGWCRIEHAVLACWATPVVALVAFRVASLHPLVTGCRWVGRGLASASS